MKVLMQTSLISTKSSPIPKKSKKMYKTEETEATAPWMALARAPSDTTLSSRYKTASPPPTAQYLFLLKCQF